MINMKQERSNEKVKSCLKLLQHNIKHYIKTIVSDVRKTATQFTSVMRLPRPR